MTSTATFTNAASIRAASIGWAERVHREDGRDRVMQKSMRRRVRLVQSKRTRRAKRPVTACRSDGRPARPWADLGRRSRVSSGRGRITTHASDSLARVSMFGRLGQRKTLAWEGHGRQQEGWQDKASSSLAGPLALSCCLHIVFWALSRSVREYRAAGFDTFFNEFNALSCHAAPQSGRTLRHGLSLHATLR